ncbi:MAG: aminotransferase class IV, partial [Rhodothermales bacterium]
VEGRLREDIGYAALFKALFPCGSVTGAPKIRAMQLIDGLEAAPRGVYCGAIGFIAPDERAVFSVAIRTAVLQEGRGEMGTGSGIVWDSDADAEYDECLLKARFLTDAATEDKPPFELIETMRWEGIGGLDGIRLLEGHLDRMRTSAHHFGFAFDEAAFRRQIHDALIDLAEGVSHRVRITLEKGGTLNITTSPLPEDNRGVWKLIISDVQADSDDVFFRHKTTRREAYNHAYRQAQEAGCDEALLLNERGEVTEGSRTNLFIQAGPVLYTPPLTSGLLGGVYRRHLLKTRTDVQERVLYPDDLRTADALYLCNAVSGLVQAELVDALIEKA